MIPQNIKAGFVQIGTWPFNPYIFSESNFCQVSVTDRAEPQEEFQEEELLKTILNKLKMNVL